MTGGKNHCMWIQDAVNMAVDCVPSECGVPVLSERQKCEQCWVDGLAGGLGTNKIVHCGPQRSNHLRNVN